MLSLQFRPLNPQSKFNQTECSKILEYITFECSLLDKNIHVFLVNRIWFDV